jgi:hypothetical protein
VEPFFPIPQYPQVARTRERGTDNPAVAAAEKVTPAEYPFIAATAISRIIGRSQNPVFVARARKLILGGVDPPVPKSLPDWNRTCVPMPVDSLTMRLAHRFAVKMVDDSGQSSLTPPGMFLLFLFYLELRSAPSYTR